jgi:hypothetical protein
MTLPEEAIEECFSVDSVVILSFSSTQTVKQFMWFHSFCSLSYDRSVASSKASSPQGAI